MDQPVTREGVGFPPPLANPRSPTVSVIIPTYNRAQYIGDALGSVLRQTFTDFEVLIADDGSTDGTTALLAGFTDLRVRVLRLEHRGISATMNAGLREARGRFIARLDSDDLWYAELLAEEVKCLEASPDVGVVYSKAQAMSADGTPREHYLGLPMRYPDDSLLSLAWGDATCNITILARRACFDSAGPYDETLRTHEDWDMWLRVAHQHRFAFLDQTLAQFREHDDSITSPRVAGFVEHIEARRRVIDKLFSGADLPARLQSFKAIAYRNVHTEVGVFLLNTGHLGRALHSFLRAVTSGANPFSASARIVWLTVLTPPLRRFAFGRRLLQIQADVRRRLQTRPTRAKSGA